MAKWLVWMALALCSGWLQAKEAAPASDDPVLEARMVALTTELRCLVCQNQTIADSHAGLAVDLRNQVREMLRRGDSDAQILDYMTARYGDFVLYRPPLKSKTALLWFGPGILLVAGLGTLFLVLRRRSRMDPSLFEPEPEQIGENERPSIAATPAKPDVSSST
ncbi:cytochrome c-type biogenesis protein [Hydrogenophaga sp. PAMC20947]|uniref:cytochrome c-type biogenesis protein n=1 Tax=Hydrogenophaga sp. PAMC20947 TaxID=2565558 RepID=UPI00109E06FF|nr:cytochrome c-type biogenesis protein [Hydrogenophaga sp. PAMC20947]QCB45698.1 cytochrome c-type biogenesis protein CcmH [Hydrogenophaga sp. PAMC20947]